MPTEENVISFQVDNELKQEFLNRQTKDTKEFYFYILQKADEFEQEIEKKIYDFNIEERNELLLTKYKNKSKGVFQSNLSPLRTYIDYCISKHVVKSNENRFATILTKDYINYINIQAMQNRYISKEEARELQQKIENAQDRLIIELLTWGIRGRTEEGNTHEELINLRVRDVDFINKIITAINNDGDIRDVYVDQYTIDLIKEAIYQDEYVCNNGIIKKDRKQKTIPINQTEYVFRTPGKNKEGKVDQQLLTRRIQSFQKWLEKPYLTIGNLWFSSLIDFAKKLKEEKGGLSRNDFIRINEVFNYGSTKEQQILYWGKTADLVKPYI